MMIDFSRDKKLNDFKVLKNWTCLKQKDSLPNIYWASYQLRLFETTIYCSNIHWTMKTSLVLVNCWIIWNFHFQIFISSEQISQLVSCFHVIVGQFSKLSYDTRISSRNVPQRYTILDGCDIRCICFSHCRRTFSSCLLESNIHQC